MGKTGRDKVISITEHTISMSEAIVGGSHYETSILDEKGRIHVGAGDTTEESQKIASEKYREAHRVDNQESSSNSSDSGGSSSGEVVI